MSLRRKLMMLLLLTAVLPMLAVRGVQALSIYKLQVSVAEDMRDRLSRQAEQDMQRTVAGFAHSLEQVGTLGYALLKIQASQVEHRLVGPPRRDNAVIPSVEDFKRFEGDPDSPWTIEPSERHAMITDDGELRPLLISYDTQVVLPITDDGPTTAAREDLAKLGSMTRVYRDIHDKVDDIILWQYTTLASGLHFSYPGKSAFPEGYQPQEKNWFQRAILARRPIGSQPYIDASTGQLVITFAQPVIGRGRTLAGVTAIDLRVSRLLDPEALNTGWSDESSVIVVAPYPTRAEAKDRIKELFEDRRPTGPRGEGRQDRADRTERPERGERVGERTRERAGEREIGEPGVDRSPAELLNTPNREPRADRSAPPDVYIVADVKQDRGERMRRPKTRTVSFDDPADREAVTQDLLAGNDGVRRVTINGADRMIAYGRIGGEGEDRPVFALITAPTRTILQPAESAIREVNQTLRASLVNTGGIMLVLLVLVGMVAYFMSDRLTRPIIEMADASKQVAGGDLDARVVVNRKDELGDLGNAFNAMVPALHDRMKMRESLAVAMQVQQSLLPDHPPRVPGLDIAGHSEYCDETGGDYYDFIELDRLGPNSIAVAVGDVTGHGVAAALLMATGRALIRSHANQPGSLGDVFTDVNKQLCGGKFTGRFMTLMYLVVQSGRDENGRVPVRYLSAGHDPVIVYRPSDDSFIELEGSDIPLGIDEGWTFTEKQSEALRPGDTLVVGTDGVWECFNSSGEQFGKDRLRDVIRSAARGSAEDIARAVSDACRSWRGEREQNDDITLVVVKLVG